MLAGTVAAWAVARQAEQDPPMGPAIFVGDTVVNYDHPFPPTGEWRVHGVYLPDRVLEKISQANADRALGWRVRDRARGGAR